MLVCTNRKSQKLTCNASCGCTCCRRTHQHPAGQVAILTVPCSCAQLTFCPCVGLLPWRAGPVAVSLLDRGGLGGSRGGNKGDGGRCIGYGGKAAEADAILAALPCKNLLVSRHWERADRQKFRQDILRYWNNHDISSPVVMRQGCCRWHATRRKRYAICDSKYIIDSESSNQRYSCNAVNSHGIASSSSLCIQA